MANAKVESDLPAFRECFAILGRTGSSVEGLFRISCTVDAREALVAALRRGKADLAALEAREADGMHVIAGAVKQMLRDYEEPLVPESEFDEVLRSACGGGGGRWTPVPVGDLLFSPC